MNDPSERRRIPDRRSRPTPMLSRYLFRGRRRGARRSEEATNVYVDRYARAEWLPVAVLLGLALVDWVWTLRHLARGIGEANPVMDWTLRAGGTLGFSVAKLAITSLGCAFLLLHARFRLTRALVPAAVVLYAGVTLCHVLTETGW